MRRDLLRHRQDLAPKASTVEVSHHQVKRLLYSIAAQYPGDLASHQMCDVNRIAFNIALVLRKNGSKATVCDLGGGLGMFSIGCAALGMRSILIDDFRDKVNTKFGPTLLDLHRSYGVEVIESDIVKVSSHTLPKGLDAVTSFDCLEHLHASPKRTLTDLVHRLNADGVLVIGGPNSVSLRKRLTVPLGIGNWSSMHDWYDEDLFRGHVREPNVADLRYIVQSLGLTSIAVYGRNWMGLSNRRRLIRWLTHAADPFIQLRPTLCSNIYVVGTKP